MYESDRVLIRTTRVTTSWHVKHQMYEKMCNILINFSPHIGQSVTLIGQCTDHWS